MRVRFPSPALLVPALASPRFRVFEACLHLRSTAFRAINGPLADRHRGASSAIVIVWLPALGFNVSINVARDDLVRAARPVLVDHGGSLAVVAHPCHKILDPSAASGSEGVAGMAKIVEVQALGAN
jgi:hypothetical protein